MYSESMAFTYVRVVEGMSMDMPMEWMEEREPTATLIAECPPHYSAEHVPIRICSKPRGVRREIHEESGTEVADGPSEAASALQ